MKLFFTTIALAFSLSLFAQPQLTLWRVVSADHNDNSNTHASELYECGSYYFFVSDGKKESTWSIKNEGNAALELNLPLTFDPSAATSMTISQQPDRASIAPGEEALFKIDYDFYGIHGDVFLDIVSNDPTHAECGLLVGGNVLSCTCYCTPSGTQSLGVCSKSDLTSAVGAIAGIPISENPCSAENVSCTPISILDPCNCNNAITTPGGQFLYRDTLSIQSTPFASMSLSANISGFKDVNGTDIAPGTNIGFGDAVTGIVKYVFYRPENEGVNIRVNGIAFLSSPCPSASLCAPATTVPTMGQWGLISLFLLLMILSVVGLNVPVQIKSVIE